MPTLNHRSLRTAGAIVAALAASSLVACGSSTNFSNPTLTVTDAKVKGDKALVEARVDNPSDAKLTLTRIDYSMVYGLFPVGSGSWALNEPLAPGDSAVILIPVAFDAEPVTDDRSIEFNGELHFNDRSNGGAREIELAAFNSSFDND